MSDSLAMASVAIYKNRAPGLSEGFVLAHARHFTRHVGTLVCADAAGATGDLMPLYSNSAAGRVVRHACMAFPYLGRSTASFRRAPRFDVWHAHFGPDAVTAAPLAAAQRSPLFATFHGYDATMSTLALLAQLSPSKGSYLLRRRSLFRGASAILAVSDFVRRRLIRLGAPEHRTVTHYIGVDTRRFVAAPRSICPETVLTVGRLVESKGHDLVLRAFAKVVNERPSARLVLVGDGPEASNLKRLASELRIAERICFRGALKGRQLLSCYQEARVFAFGSRIARSGAEEALGLVLNEAAACGAPIVAMDQGGISEAAIHGFNAQLVKSGDTDGFAHALLCYLDEPAMADAHGRAGRDLVERRFDVRRQAARLEEMYLEALSRDARS